MLIMLLVGGLSVVVLAVAWTMTFVWRRKEGLPMPCLYDKSRPLPECCRTRGEWSDRDCADGKVVPCGATKINGQRSETLEDCCARRRKHRSTGPECRAALGVPSPAPPPPPPPPVLGSQCASLGPSQYDECCERKANKGTPDSSCEYY